MRDELFSGHLKHLIAKFTDRSAVIGIIGLGYNNPRASITQYCYSGVTCIGSGNITANNLVYGNGSGISLKTGTATSTIALNPLFVNYQANGTGNYRLQSNSPAVNKGLATSAPTTDIDYYARPRGTAHDIGAYESY